MAGWKKSKGSWRSQNEWQSLLAKFGGCGMGVEAFCQREAISAASFYRWRSRLSHDGDGGVVEGGETASAFVDLGTLNCESAPRAQFDLRVDLGDGLVLHLVRS